MSSSVALVCGLGARDDKGVSLNARVFGAEKPIPSRCAKRWRQLSTWSISAQSNGQRELTRDRSGGDRLSPGRGQYIRYICGANHYASRPNPVPRDHQYPRDGEHNSQMALQNHRGGCLRAVSPGYRSGYAASVIRRVRTFQAFTAFVASRNDTHAPPPASPVFTGNRHHGLCRLWPLSRRKAGLPHEKNLYATSPTLDATLCVLVTTPPVGV